MDKNPTPTEEATMGSHLTTITPKAASGHGDLDGFTVRCSCGDVAHWAFESMAHEYARDHAAYMAAKEADQAMAVMPASFNADGSAVCAHRDLSVCATCATHPFYVEVTGAHYWLPEASDRAELAALVAS